MSLPPEQINIKRRREEEPVETLYIQSEFPQTKRRFTDFVFQRILVGSHGATKSLNPSPSPGPSGQQTVGAPRPASSLGFTSASEAAASSTIDRAPRVRATSPGAEFRERKRLAVVRREAEEKFTKGLYSPRPLGPAVGAGAMANIAAGASRIADGSNSSTPSPGAPCVRRFQISRTSTPLGFRRGTGGGIQKRRVGSVSDVAVLVERLKQPHSRKASMAADLLAAEDMMQGVLANPEEFVRPRKRPVVNQAEKRWREEHRDDISIAKRRITQMANADQDETDNQYAMLARHFDQVALDLGDEMGTAADDRTEATQLLARPVLPKPPLKYQPRVSSRRQPSSSTVQGERTDARFEETTIIDGAAPGTQSSHVSEHDGCDGGDGDGDYVYDTYIRRPLLSSWELPSALPDDEASRDMWFQQHGVDVSRPDVGIIVIPAEDEQYWEHFAESEEGEDQWDSEDADSNAEDNPANDYPDEELSWDDDGDDTSAIYEKYGGRGRDAASDDEEFNIYDSASEGRGRFDD